MAVYNISTLEQLQAITPDHLADDCVLLNNIDASATSEWNEGAGFIPIGIEAAKFTGKFDGGGHTITGLFINSASNEVSLFGFTDGAEIKDIGMIDVDITAVLSVGGLVGVLGGGSITNCYTTGSVNGTGYYVGGLAGYVYVSAVVSKCYSTAGVISNTRYVGGLVGLLSTGIISVCYTTGSVSTDTSRAGGLVGLNRGLIIDCHSSSPVSADNYFGGLVGWNEDGGIINCYATGDVTENEAYRDGGGIGGLVGYNDGGTIAHSFATGTIDSGNPENSSGGLCGLNGGRITNSFFTDSDYDNGNGTLESRGESAFYGNTHPVYVTILIIGLPLVETDDSDASPIRIYNGSAIKALAKYT